MSSSRAASNCGVLHVICIAAEPKSCAIRYSLNLTGAAKIHPNPLHAYAPFRCVEVRLNDSANTSRFNCGLRRKRAMVRASIRRSTPYTRLFRRTLYFELYALMWSAHAIQLWALHRLANRNQLRNLRRACPCVEALAVLRQYRCGLAGWDVNCRKARRLQSI